ncbi:MAG: PCRF domain-containing protein [Nostoc sp.]|uniref:PCRF domain-containing protein n=1 Tax=Nostoc sp. TaxID=1180 RepID=UPI002FF95AE7
MLELSADEQLWQEAQTNLTQLQQELETAEIRQLLSDSHDKKGALLTITAEVDNADSQYWAYMLLQMYWRWGKSHNYQLDVVEISEGNESGVKYATLEITASCAYGYLKSETGTHQLQQISPFDVINRLADEFS